MVLKAWNAAAPSDHHTPLPPNTSGRSAFASSAMASLIAAGSPSVRGAGFQGPGNASRLRCLAEVALTVVLLEGYGIGGRGRRRDARPPRGHQVTQIRWERGR